MPKRNYKVEWNANAQRYAFRTPKGGYGFLSEEKVRGIIDADIDVSGARMGKIGNDLKKQAQRFKDGGIDRAAYDGAVQNWRDSMAAHVKAAHVGQAASAVGGAAQMGNRENGRVGGLLRVQYRYLENAAAEFAADPERVLGEVPGQMGVDERGVQYAEASRATFERFADINAGENGAPWCVNMLEPRAHHCSSKAQPHRSCPGQTDLGAVRYDDPLRLIPGMRVCRTKCRCSTRRFKTKAAALRLWRDKNPIEDELDEAA